jgi:hypothetical protein
MGRTSKKHRGNFERPEGSGVWWVPYYDQYGRRLREKLGFKSAPPLESTNSARQKFMPALWVLELLRGSWCLALLPTGYS